MQPARIVPGVYLLPFEVGQVYLWDWGDGVTVVDTGIAGSAPAILEAVGRIGRQPEDVKEVVLTHFHDDHRGSAGEVARRTGATVIAHREETPFIRGERPGPPPVLLDWERPILEAVLPKVPEAAPVAVDRVADDGDRTLGGGVLVHVPGHTPGSLALHVPPLGVVFTGDTIASHEGRAILGVFNADRAGAIRSLRKQAGLGVEVACFGHGAPLVGGAGARLLALAETL
jgi:glyoxylase-like metal-dependent hydrolase (beta-lactamase superfamily II)